MQLFEGARALLYRFKGEKYLYGFNVLPKTGAAVASFGKRAVLVGDNFPGSPRFITAIQDSLKLAEVELLQTVDGAAPNAPREDLARITARLEDLNPDVVVSFGGGSTIDTVKAAGVLRTLGGGIEDYFGVGLVSRAIAGGRNRLLPHVAIQTAASSGAHLTKYSNITDLKSGQKKLIVDEAIIPTHAIFDYATTFGAPAALTADGALDGVSHLLEVLYGAVGKGYCAEMEEVARLGISLVMKFLPRVLENPNDAEGREALALATDLGGYAIMLGGTNGAHLTSFSLIDVLSHGRACAMLNPYYTVLFAPAIQEPLKLVAEICIESGYAGESVRKLSGRALGLGVAEALIHFERSVGLPSTLGEVAGFSDAHIERALTAAKNPQLRMKLENMPIPLTAATVDRYMRPVLEAAKTGDLSLIPAASTEAGA